MRKRAAMKKTGSIILFTTMFFLIFGANTYADLVSDGRTLLFNHGNPTYSGLLTANQKFKDALSADSYDQEANLFYAVTRIGAFALEEGSGGGLKTLRDVFQAFGMTRNSNEFMEYTSPDDPYDTEFNSPYDAPSQLPANSPSGEEIRQFLAGPVIDLLDSAIDNLDAIKNDPPFQINLTADETGDEAVEIDYGDVLMYKAMLNAGRCLVLIMSSYNIDVDIDEIGNKINNDQFSINTDLLDTYPNFLKIVTGGSNTLQFAEAALLDAIDRYLEASASIRSESDDQLNDLISFDPEELPDELLFRQNLDELKASLNENRTANLTDDVEHLALNLSLFFGYDTGPYNLRDFLPRFNQNDDPIAGTVGHGLGNDATLGGILPDYKQADWGIPIMSMPWIPLLLLDD